MASSVIAPPSDTDRTVPDDLVRFFPNASVKVKFHLVGVDDGFQSVGHVVDGGGGNGSEGVEDG